MAEMANAGNSEIALAFFCMIRSWFSNPYESPTDTIYCSNLVGNLDQQLSCTTTSDEMWSSSCAIARHPKPYVMSTPPSIWAGPPRCAVVQTFIVAALRGG
jgi:hypothetical protein